jgi:hypothetical protein
MASFTGLKKEKAVSTKKIRNKDHEIRIIVLAKGRFATLRLNRLALDDIRKFLVKNEFNFLSKKIREVL